jgi:glycosyltransferase involved in cell wall biosynthesis
MNGKRSVVAVWNELTPYRLHVMRRVRDELPDVRVVNVFTHSVLKNSSPWKMEVPPDLNVVFDEPNRVPRVEQFVHARAWRLASSIEQVIGRSSPVFVLMHGHNDLTRYLLIKRLRRAGVPMVHASDVNIFSEQPGRGWKRALKAAYRAYRTNLLRLMDGYMPMGVAGRAFYNLYGRQDVPYFAFPYEPDYALIRNRDPDAERMLREEFRLPEARRRFLYSGRLVAGKGIQSMLSAFQSTAAGCPDRDLVIAGDGPLRRELEESVPASLRDRVRFLGFMQMERLRSVYHVCDVLLHPSERDQWGLVINEAVAADMAVIATDVIGAAADLVRHGINGIIVRPRSGEAMAAAILEISRPGVSESLRRNSARVLSEWQTSADPIRGFRAAVEHFSRIRPDHAGRPSSKEN